MKYFLSVFLLCAVIIKPCAAQDLSDEKEAKLTAAQLADFKDQAKKTINTLSDYITVIGNKVEESGRRKSAVSLAVKLFMTDSNVVEVSSLKTAEIKRYPIRTYLNKLLLLPYDQVTIKWYDIYLSSSFELRKDGRYYGVATVYQKFEGTSSTEYGNRKYTDITKKNIQIIVEKMEQHQGDKVVNIWRLYLGDIRVDETHQ